MSGKDSLSLDVWSETAGKVNVYLISGVYPAIVEAGVVVDVTAGEWNAISIDLADYTPGLISRK